MINEYALGCEPVPLFHALVPAENLFLKLV